MEARFQVLYPMPLLRQVKFVKLDRPGAKADLRKALDASLLDGTGTVDLEFARSPLAEAAGSIDYLLHYPYGCVEQTTSSLIPWCAVDDLKDVIPAFAKLSEKKVQAAIQAGADRLLSMQLPNGSFTYWPGGNANRRLGHALCRHRPHVGLHRRRERARMPPSSRSPNTSSRACAAWPKPNPPAALESHARALLRAGVRADTPQPAYQSAMIDRIAQLTPAARSLLAAAIAHADPDNQAKLATARSVLTSKVPFTLKNDSWMPWSPDQRARIDRLVRHRRPTAPKPPPPSTACSMSAIPTATGATPGSMVGRSSPWASMPRTRNRTRQAIALKLEYQRRHRGPSNSRRKLPPPSAHCRSARTSNSRSPPTTKPSSGCRVASKPPVAPLQPVANNGLSIDRLYYRVNPDGSADPLTEPKLGDLIRVTLRVTLPKDDTRYLVIEDPLPAVFETVNTDFASQSSALGVRTSEQDWNVSHSELRSDRAVFFLDEVWRKGTYTVTYLARCTLAGQATAPPAKVESMYDPENFALSASRVFRAK